MKKILLFSAMLCCMQQQLSAQSKLWVTDGSVSSMVQSGNTLYVGGNFSHVGPNTPYGCAVDAISGAPNTAFARPNDVVYAVVADGNGGWYIGGNFTKVGSNIRNHLAQINASGNVTAWNPDVNGSLKALCLSGSALYIGGSFTQVGSAGRTNLAAVDISTGIATAWNPASDASVNAIAFAGNSVYAGGSFTSIGGQSKNLIASIDAVTGLANSWNPNPGTAPGNVINTISITGSTVYAGGIFSVIGGQTRKNIAALSAITGAATSWAANADLEVKVIVASGSVVYAGGAFSAISGVARDNIAALNTTTGAATAWHPLISGNPVTTITPLGSTVILGGNILSIGGQTRNGVGAVDATTGAVTTWNPDVIRNGNTVYATSAVGSNIFIGGDFAMIGAKTRNNLAALDLTTGAATSFNPNLNSGVTSMLIKNAALYAGGYFTNIGSVTRNYIAAIDLTTGSPTSWNPGANSNINSLAVSGNTIYAGGGFTAIGGQPRNMLAAMDVVTGIVTGFNPNPTGVAFGYIKTLTVSGSTLYTSGYFTAIGGQSRNYCGAVDITTGMATSWNPAGSSAILCDVLLASGGLVYAGGQTSIGSVNFFAAIDGTTGAVTSWNPNVNGIVSSINVSGSKVFAGGSFTSAGGQPRHNFAAFDLPTGNLNALNPDISTANNGGGVNAILVNGTSLYVGGYFDNVNKRPYGNLVAIDVNSGAPLSIKLTAFTARNIANERNQIDWKTAIEEAGTTFEIERSADGREFISIGSVNANGKSSSYTFYDVEPLSGTNYYRLRLTGSGIPTYSSIEIVRGDRQAGSVIVSPVPAGQTITIRNTNALLTGCKATIYDMQGRSVYSLIMSASQQIDISQWAAGTYVLKLQNGEALRVVRQ